MEKESGTLKLSPAFAENYEIDTVKVMDELTKIMRELHNSFVKCELLLTDLMMGAEGYKI